MSDETAPQSRIKTSWLIGTAAAFALFALIAAYSSRMTWDYPDYDQQRAKARAATLDKVQKAENALLDPAVDAQGKSHAEWIDQAKGTVRLPIDEAMAREIDTLKAQAPRMGSEIPPPPPPAPAAGATKTAPAKPAASVTPEIVNQPVFKTRKINTTISVRNARGDVISTGHLINSSATNAAPASANPPPAQPNPANK